MNNVSDRDQQNTQGSIGWARACASDTIAVSLLTGGSDRPYVYGLTDTLLSKSATLDIIGSDELNDPEICNKPGVNFLNLRGDQRPGANFRTKISRIISYYSKLIRYAATAKPRIFHILWNNKFETFDRTVLMVYYKLLGKKIVFTAHNVNIAARDHNDSAFNRLTLRIQYRLADHIFVHTEMMKSELIRAFGVRESRVTVIPFGINNSVPNTDLTPSEARKKLDIRCDEKAILFFGRIKPYKGLEYLIAASRRLPAKRDDYRLLVVGSLDALNGEQYNNAIREAIRADVPGVRTLLRAEFVPDSDIEVYFKAADVLVLPYTDIYQSGVLFLAHSFGLPVLAADVGSLKDDIVEGKTGFVFKPQDPVDLARAIEIFFASDLYANLDAHRQEIKDYAKEQHSWDVVGRMTMSVYAGLLRNGTRKLADSDAPSISVSD
jgi:glycosyltransferase involved in cell wall biosynthesis